MLSHNVQNEAPSTNYLGTKTNHCGVFPRDAVHFFLLLAI